jgi:anti-sigma factor ChrR (cupin superfamily)
MVSQPHAIDLAALLAGGAVWSPLLEGIDICRLHGDASSGPSAALLRYAPNARVPMHEHDGCERVFVLSGSQTDDAGVYPAGTMIVNPSGTRHTVRSPEGCLVLVVWEHPVIWL